MEERVKLSGRTALITGAAGALGNVIARRFAREGASLSLPVRTPEQGASLQKIPGLSAGQVYVGTTDLADEASVQAFVVQTLSKFRTIDILVNAAGGYAGGRLVEDVSVDEWDRLMNMNLKTTFLLSRAVLAGMKERNAGRIITIAAAGALAPAAKRGPYQVSKRAVITLTETIAEETKGTGITANAIAPSIILTEANRLSMPDPDSSRWVPPEEIAGLILYLCTDEARSITGNTIKM